MILLGRQLKDSLPAIPRYANIFEFDRVAKAWRDMWQQKEIALADRLGKNVEKLNKKTKVLPDLEVNQKVRVQTLTGTDRKWIKTGTVVQIGDHHQYLIRMDGSRRLLLRNRKFLRAYTSLRETKKKEGNKPNSMKKKEETVVKKKEETVLDSEHMSIPEKKKSVNWDKKKATESEKPMAKKKNKTREEKSEIETPKKEEDLVGEVWYRPKANTTRGQQEVRDEVQTPRRAIVPQVPPPLVREVIQIDDVTDEENEDRIQRDEIAKAARVLFPIQEDEEEQEARGNRPAKLPGALRNIRNNMNPEKDDIIADEGRSRLRERKKDN